MNKYIYISFLSLTLFFSSCSDFLNVDVIGKNDTDTFFAELDGLRSALPGAYSVAYKFYDNGFIKYGDVTGNMLRMNNASSSSDMVDQYNFTSQSNQETTAVGLLWKNGYVVMTNVNNILKYGPRLKSSYPHDVDEIDNICAQAYFLRALMHLNISLCYSQPYNYTSDASHLGIPVLLQTPSANASVSRATMAETYARIVEDLNIALKTFTPSFQSNIYYASPLACKALLARVYLYMEKWDLAEQYATEVIKAHPLALRADYIDMFSKNSAGEAIFRLSGYNAGRNTSKFYQYGSALAFPADTLYSLFADNRDIRKNLLYYDPDTKKRKVCMKYYLQNNTDTKKGSDLPVLRVSEMYLIRAEARMRNGKLDDAVADIKELEARALGITPAEVTLTYLNVVELDRIIEIEGIKELSFEGHRFFDIVRQKKDVIREKGTNSSMQHLVYPDYRYVLPISIVERDANRAIQPNPGYN